jgi:hypothetical protein
VNARLQAALLVLRYAHFNGKRGKPMPTTADARDLLAELAELDGRAEASTTVSTPDELAALKPDTVIRDDQGYVLELLESGQWAWGETAMDVDLPATILALPEEES